MMSCSLCTMKLIPDMFAVMDRACGPCQRQLKQMKAGFHGVVAETRPTKSIWDNTVTYNQWLKELTEADTVSVQLTKKDDYVLQRCDIRDMKRIAGLPKFLALEDQVFTAWINDGVKDEKIQEVLGLTYSQLVHVKKVIRIRLRKQMAYYHQIKKLAKEGKNG